MLLVLAGLPCLGQDRQFKYDSTRLEIKVDSLIVNGESRFLKCYWRATNHYGTRLRLDYDLMPEAWDTLNKQFLLFPQTSLNRKRTDAELQARRSNRCGVIIRKIYMPSDSTVSMVTEYEEEKGLKIREIKSLDVYFDDGRRFRVPATHK